MNKTILSGRITRDPEVRYTNTGMPTVRFSLAVDRMTRDQNGQRTADFINCVAFQQSADFISRYVKKGNMLLVEGRIQTGSYQAQDGTTRYTTDVIVERVENMTPRADQQPQAAQPGSMANTYPNPSYQSAQAAPTYQPQPEAEAPKMPDSFNVADDDLPF